MGRLRIIGGQWRGRQLPVASAPGLRPTPDRVRETLFNWLAPWIAGANCLDLFAGSGALGFEALSRGAQSLTLVETSAAARKQLAQSAALLQITPKIIAQDALRFLAADTGRYDVVFVDPPFAADLWRPALQALRPRLAPQHRVYVESPRGMELVLPAGWQPCKASQAGEVVFRLLAYSDDAATSDSVAPRRE